ncbi:MAG TPA: DNA-binding domain-containing protein [Lamprocystis sp. (in: g-proteobacteria)]|nr:DNA-binding domain-containing protein [Lamprocystis sp. (in: g-proteobacteria)]
MSELQQIQARFAAALLAPGGDPGLLFRGAPDLMSRRFALYRGNLTANWEKALANAYPIIRALVGEAFFRALAREYGRATPLVEGDLNCFGHLIPGFLEGFPPVSDYAYLPDMARLEWGLHRAHYALDTPTLTPQTLATLRIEDLDGLRLALHGACTLVESPWDLLGIWEAHQPTGAPWPDTLARTSRALVCRPRWRAELVPLTAGELKALRAINQGATLGEALEQGLDADPAFDPAQALPRWLGAGAFDAVPSSQSNQETPP